MSLLCVTLVGLAQVIRKPVARVTLFAEAAIATFVLEANWLWGAPVSGSRSVHLGGLHDVDLPPALARQLDSDPGAHSSEVSGGALSLAILSTGAGGRVTLEADGGKASVSSKKRLLMET